MAKVFIPTVIVAIIALIVLPQTFFTIDETQLAIVTRFGELRRDHTEPGLRVKIPFIDSVTRFDKRLLRADAPAASLLTRDKRNLVIDSYARYRIVEPRLFFRSLRSEREADSRVSAIVNSQLRTEVALDNQEEIIEETRELVMQRVTEASNRFEIDRERALRYEPDGLSNREVEILKLAVAQDEQIDRDTALAYQPDGLRNTEVKVFKVPRVQDPDNPVEPEPVTATERSSLVRDANPVDLEGFIITYFQPATGVRAVPVTPEERAALQREESPPELEGFTITYFQPLSRQFGVEILDVRIKGADFPDDVEESVFARMRAEREVQASGLRSEGAEQDLEIRAETDRTVEETLERARGDAARTRGEGEGEAITILAGALELDPEFYDFQRTLEAYRTTLDGNTTILLDANSDLFKFLQDPFGIDEAATDSN